MRYNQTPTTINSWTPSVGHETGKVSSFARLPLAVFCSRNSALNRGKQRHSPVTLKSESIPVQNSFACVQRHEPRATVANRLEQQNASPFCQSRQIVDLRDGVASGLLELLQERFSLCWRNLCVSSASCAAGRGRAQQARQCLMCWLAGFTQVCSLTQCLAQALGVYQLARRKLLHMFFWAHWQGSVVVFIVLLSLHTCPEENKAIVSPCLLPDVPSDGCLWCFA